MKYFLPLLGSLLLLGSCRTTRNGLKDDRRIDISFVQINDVYEIAPLAGGREGGMARVATLKKQIQQKTPATFLVVAGDFLSPSVYNSLQFEGRAIRGRQMVDVLNAAGLDFAVFGNHEFDIREKELQERINESRFQWISSNVFHRRGNENFTPFAKEGGSAIPQTHILRLRDADGTTANIGIIAVCLPFNKADYVSYTDPIETAKSLYQRLRDSVDAVVAFTHQSMEEDERLARELPGLAAIIGGHEHDGRYAKVGNVIITKALANAKSAYVINLHLRGRKKKWKTDADLKIIDEQVPFDSTTHAVVQRWTDIAERNYASLGFDARRVLIATGEGLDGRESAVRTGPTNLTRLILAAMKTAAPQADAALLNAGSIRVDDVLPMPLTEYDVIRTLPFGGGIREAELKGSLLLRVLEQGEKNRGIGGYLLHSNGLVRSGNNWQLNGQPILPDATYRVAMGEFLFTGKEANLDFLNPQNGEVTRVFPAETGKTSPLSDIRLAIVQYLIKK